MYNERGVRKVIQLNNHLISSHEENIIWKKNGKYSSYQLIKKLNLHSSYVFSFIQLENNILVSIK